jgi:hypothetical protein
MYVFNVMGISLGMYISRLRVKLKFGEIKMECGYQIATRRLIHDPEFQIQE